MGQPALVAQLIHRKSQERFGVPRLDPPANGQAQRVNVATRIIRAKDCLQELIQLSGVTKIQESAHIKTLLIPQPSALNMAAHGMVKLVSVRLRMKKSIFHPSVFPKQDAPGILLPKFALVQVVNLHQYQLLGQKMHLMSVRS